MQRRLRVGRAWGRSFRLNVYPSQSVADSGGALVLYCRRQEGLAVQLHKPRPTLLQLSCNGLRGALESSGTAAPPFPCQAEARGWPIRNVRQLPASRAKCCAAVPCRPLTGGDTDLWNGKAEEQPVIS